MPRLDEYRPVRYAPSMSGDLVLVNPGRLEYVGLPADSETPESELAGGAVRSALGRLPFGAELGLRSALPRLVPGEGLRRVHVA